MALPTTKTKEASVITPRQKFEGHIDGVWGVIHLPGGQRIITCSFDGSLRVWNLESGKQIGEDWRDGKSAVESIALSPDGKKVVSGCLDGAVRLWDVDTCKVIARWTGHTNPVWSVCWSRDGRRVLSGSSDGTAKQWDVESGEAILEPIIMTRPEYSQVLAAVYSPDTTLIATSGRGYDGSWTGAPVGSSITIWDTKTGELVATLEGHMDAVRCLAWTPDGKTLISGSFDNSIRTWNTTKWEQIAVLVEHTFPVYAIAISSNGRILASASFDSTARLWNLDDGQPIGSSLQHARPVQYVSFSDDGMLLATGCSDQNAYTWDVAAIVRESGLDNLLDPKANELALHSDATRRAVQRRPPAYRVPQGFFDGVPPDGSQSPSQSGPHSSEPQARTLLRRLFHRSPSNAQDTTPSSSLDWARNLLKLRKQGGEGTKLQGRSPAVVEVPCAPGKRRNACAREKRKRLIPLKSPTASSSRPPKPNVTQQFDIATQTQPSLQPHQAASNSPTAPTVGDNTAATASTPSRPDVILRRAGLWTRFWLFIGCLSPEYQDGRH